MTCLFKKLQLKLIWHFSSQTWQMSLVSSRVSVFIVKNVLFMLLSFCRGSGRKHCGNIKREFCTDNTVLWKIPTLFSNSDCWSLILDATELYKSFLPHPIGRDLFAAMDSRNDYSNQKRFQCTYSNVFGNMMCALQLLRWTNELCAVAY